MTHAISNSPDFSQWIQFLRKYGPIPRNDNMYDEVIQRTLQRRKVDPIEFEANYIKEIVADLQSQSSTSIILTGTAGDGKTYCCRQIWKILGGSTEEWQKDDKIRSLELSEESPICRKLVVIKDLSELTLEEKNQILPGVAAAVRGQDDATVYLIAANDGQLIEAWVGVEDQSDDIKAVRQAIEELLVSDRSELDGFQLRLHNLSRQSAAAIFPRILDAVLQHPGWEACESCSYQNQGCPIWENKKRLEGRDNKQITRRRLLDLLLLCDLDDIHLPIRQLLILISNAILGHPDAKDKLLDCRQVPKILEKKSSALGSLYRNILGENLPERRRDSIEIFKALRGFGIGTETNNRIDSILIFGADDSQFLDLYQQLIVDDQLYGANSQYTTQQNSYLNGESRDKNHAFLKLMKTQRQRLFFTVPNNEIQFWDLTIFCFAGEFLDKVYRSLCSGKKCPRDIIIRLVRGLNSIFIGLPVRNQDELILATSGNYSQARISKIHEESISVWQKHGEYVDVEIHNDKLFLVVYLSNDPQIYPVRLQLSPTRYEYLARVADGALPSVFSQECYEDLLAFKAQLINQVIFRESLGRERYGSSVSTQLRVLELNLDGVVIPQLLEVSI
ncbi:MAG: hypothetical protein HC910_12420 [Spirulinaceae cyanobacterium SM2_1_0]|nr:hypothetical protein [Spirulinaceae cyanobacterium SM2_1_0]